jgi:hypothetical protein
VIVPQHRKIKKATKKYWNELDAAYDSLDKQRIMQAQINLNSALEAFR